MLFNIPYCNSQAPVAAVAAISSLRFSSSSPALIPPLPQPLVSPPPALPEENPFAALLASDPPPPEPLRLVLDTGDVHSALRGLPGLARQLFSWAEDTPRGFPRTASAFAAVLVPLRALPCLAPRPAPRPPPPPRVPPPIHSPLSRPKIPIEPPLTPVHQVLHRMPSSRCHARYPFDAVPTCLP
ncbi:pentatricopeptide repeat-containing protein [Panicum miliaceum]|uniref:Pentatricopeptide repeat-containing protein n=1 Tax=Panicum miliaceum TaxID=4540 RepID=A0A3L6RAA7_PANMI|nr:pentatricopeptide repeat-containing protein [Panicum miliaceum]